MAFELLGGHLPFPGPEFQNQHLKEEPPLLARCPPLLASLVTECLFKAPEVRSTAANLLACLPLILRPPSPAAGQLQATNQAQAHMLANEATVQSAARSLGGRAPDKFGIREKFRWLAVAAWLLSQPR
jgi:serine/threonine-protein kinase